MNKILAFAVVLVGGAVLLLHHHFWRIHNPAKSNVYWLLPFLPSNK